MAVGYEKFIWTRHAGEKMRYYRLTESRIKRIIRHPTRTEGGVLEGAVACMQPALGIAAGEARPKKFGRPAGNKYSEIWVMYVIVNSKFKDQNSKLNGKKIKVITAWRYPGKSPARDPIPQEILREVRNIL